MNPYKNLPKENFWSSSISAENIIDVDFDYGKKYQFAAADIFATAGSCFAQHFAKKLSEMGGHLLITEERHPLIPEDCDHGYNVFSARYGNIYTVRQLLELLEQAFGYRNTIYDFCKRKDGRIIDMLRPRAVPIGFASVKQAMADRNYHLSAVKSMIVTMNVFVFTIGLTEAWINVDQEYCYPVLPGAVAGEYSPRKHKFINYSFSEIVGDFTKVVNIILSNNPKARILLTVSPVSLVATYEKRNVIVSTIASKSIIRAAVDKIVRDFDAVDYFPSYEIIIGSYSKGVYWAEDLRDVTEDAVNDVMQVFIKSRIPDIFHNITNDHIVVTNDLNDDIRKAITKECDEMYLDAKIKPGNKIY